MLSIKSPRDKGTTATGVCRGKSPQVCSRSDDEEQRVRDGSEYGRHEACNEAALMNHSDSERTPLRREGALALVGWILLLVGMGAVSGMLFGPDAWFAALEKPAWNPPSWLFGPVWTTLYAMMGLALWLVRREPEAADGRRKRAQVLFAVQFGLNMAWTPVFFGLHSPGMALVTIGLLWVTLLATILAFSKVRGVAGALLVPYLLWVSFATALNGAIWQLNS